MLTDFLCRRNAKCCFRRQIGSQSIPSFSVRVGSKRRMQGSWLKAVLAKTSLSARDWFRIAVSRGGQWQAAGRGFFPKRKMPNGHSLRHRSWKRGSPLPIPPPAFCLDCKEDLGSVAALGAHHNSFHAIRDNRLVTKPSFQCSRFDLVFHSKWRLRNHSCSRGDKLLSAETIVAIASNVRRP